MDIRGPLLHLFARLPLPLVHFIGAALGVLSLLRGRHRRTIADNLRAAGLYSPGLVLRSSVELGKSITELVPIWLRSLEDITAWVREVEGWEHVEAARAAGKGFIVMGPHLGCLELAGLYMASRTPLTALFRRPRQDWVYAMMLAGRNRGLGKAVEPNLRGVRALLSALKHNEGSWVLPDQKANKGEGAWAPFFGRWAYMPTLLYRLMNSSGARMLLFRCERLSWGRGYRLVIEPMPELPADTDQAMRVVNRILEERIRRLPGQYLWTYDLHRVRQHETPPEGPAR